MNTHTFTRNVVQGTCYMYMFGVRKQYDCRHIACAGTCTCTFKVYCVHVHVHVCIHVHVCVGRGLLRSSQDSEAGKAARGKEEHWRFMDSKQWQQAAVSHAICLCHTPQKLLKSPSKHLIH